MYVDEIGNGDRTVIAVHGWAGTHRDFAAIAKRMPPGFRFLSVDLPGCGESPAPAEWTLEAILKPVEELIRTVGDPSTVLIGFCSGAAIALMQVPRNPELIGRVVMVDPLVFLPWYFALFTWGAFGRRAYQATFASPIGRRITNAALQRRQTAEADFTAAFAGADHTATQNYLRVFASTRTEDWLRPVGKPVYICFGERTFGAVRRSVAELRAVIPHARIHELPGSGHLPLIRSARQIAAVIAADEPLVGLTRDAITCPQR